MPNATVVLARTHGHMVEPRFYQSYEQLVDYSRAHGITVLPAVVERLHVDRARNEIVDMVLHPETPRPPMYPEGVGPAYKAATHILFLDDDMVFPPAALVQLLKHDLPIVGGLYFARQAPHLPIIYRYVKDTQWVAITQLGAGLQEVDAIGAGCLLIKREVLEQMPRPWFEFSDKMGEDMYFCEQAKKLGHPIVCDTDVVCKHLATIEVDRDLYLAHKAKGLNFAAGVGLSGDEIRRLSEEARPYRKPGRHLHLLVNE